jgi:EamA domain-containing membrane protein RarD
VATLAELAFPLSAIVVNRIWFGDTLTGGQWVGVLVLMATLTVMSAKPDTRELGVRAPQLDAEPASIPPYS